MKKSAQLSQLTKTGDFTSERKKKGFDSRLMSVNGDVTTVD
jgi:hypothetical protein